MQNISPARTAMSDPAARQGRIVEAAEADAERMLCDYECRSSNAPVSGGKSQSITSQGADTAHTDDDSHSSTTRGTTSKPDRINRRREINRVNAKRSRLRKKFFVESLLQTVEKLEAENEGLRARLASPHSQSVDSAPSIDIQSAGPATPFTVAKPIHATFIVKTSTAGGCGSTSHTGEIAFACADARRIASSILQKSLFSSGQEKSPNAEFLELMQLADFRLIEPPKSFVDYYYRDILQIQSDPQIRGVLVDGGSLPNADIVHAQDSKILKQMTANATYECVTSLHSLKQAIASTCADSRCRILMGWIRVAAESNATNEANDNRVYQCYGCTILVHAASVVQASVITLTCEPYSSLVTTDIDPIASTTESHDNGKPSKNSAGEISWSPYSKQPSEGARFPFMPNKSRVHAPIEISQTNRQPPRASSSQGSGTEDPRIRDASEGSADSIQRGSRSRAPRSGGGSSGEDSSSRPLSHDGDSSGSPSGSNSPDDEAASQQQVLPSSSSRNTQSKKRSRMPKNSDSADTVLRAAAGLWELGHLDTDQHPVKADADGIKRAKVTNNGASVNPDPTGKSKHADSNPDAAHLPVVTSKFDNENVSQTYWSAYQRYMNALSDGVPPESANRLRNELMRAAHHMQAAYTKS